MKRVFSLICIWVLLPGLSFANPVNLDAPRNTIGSAGLHGELRVWREICDVDFGEDMSIPLRVEFSSDRETASPYAGYGWWIPLLEANAFLKREKMMEAKLLCGKTMFLRRSKNDASKFYTLDKEWTGTMDGDAIVISREDGWALRYHQGHIHQLRTDTGRVLTWERNGNLVTEIREEGKPGAALRLLTTAGGVPHGFEVNGEDHRFEMDERPRIQHVNGQNLIGALEPSLASWKWPNGETEEYDFEVSPPDLIPSLTLTNRDGEVDHYTWNSQNHSVISDGEWSYTVGNVTEKFGLPRIERVNSEGQTEFIAVDNLGGVTEEKTLSGGHRITKVFKSPGPLYGKVRTIEIVEDGVKHLHYAASYDDLGRMVRETNSHGITTAYTFNEDGEINGKKILDTRDEEVMKGLKAKEERLLAAVAQAVSERDVNKAVQDLAFFYIHEMREPAQALAVAPKLTNQKKLYAVKLHAVNHSDKLSPEQKVTGYQKLINEFPDEREQLEWLIERTGN